MSCWLLAASACGGNGGSPSAPSPSPTATSVAVTFPSGGTIFIGAQAQLRATVTMSDGSTQDRTSSAVWGSDAPGIATVATSGMVTAVAAGEATIFADVSVRGTIRIRVFPEFAGTWAGSEVVTVCEESGVFVGLLCVPEELGVGNTFRHDNRFTQNNASVTATILFSDSASTMTGTVAIDGQAELPPAPVLPAIEGLVLETRNFKARADRPGRMTGAYEWVFTAPGLDGSSRQVYELRDVVKSGPATVAARSSVSSVATRLERTRRRLAMLRR
jgi:hypothetical protein